MRARTSSIMPVIFSVVITLNPKPHNFKLGLYTGSHFWGLGLVEGMAALELKACDLDSEVAGSTAQPPKANLESPKGLPRKSLSSHALNAKPVNSIGSRVNFMEDLFLFRLQRAGSKRKKIQTV